MKAGDRVTYYPRSGKPGHVVTIVAVRPHPFYGASIRFRYEEGKNKGRERELYKTNFHTTP